MTSRLFKKGGIPLFIFLSTFLFSPSSHSQEKNNSQKLNTVFAYADACHWMSPNDCERLTPNFNSLDSVAPYRALCQNMRPSECLVRQNLMPSGNPNGPLSFNTLGTLDILIFNSKSACDITKSIQDCMDEDRAKRSEPHWAWERDRRLFRTLQAKESGDWYVYWPLMVAKYAGFCGKDTVPSDCVEAYAPRRPSPNNPQVDTIYNFAELCHWKNVENCLKQNTSLNLNSPVIDAYRHLCGSIAPAHCIYTNRIFPDIYDRREPLPLNLFQTFEMVMYNAKSICGLDKRNVNDCLMEDASRSDDRRLRRDLWALNDQAFTFFPWQLGAYVGICGMNWDIPTCLAYYAPQKPAANLSFLSVPVSIVVPQNTSASTGGERDGAHEGTTPSTTPSPRTGSEEGPPSASPSSGESPLPPLFGRGPSHPEISGEATPPAPAQENTKAASTAPVNPPSGNTASAPSNESCSLSSGVSGNHLLGRSLIYLGSLIPLLWMRKRSPLP